MSQERDKSRILDTEILVDMTGKGQEALERKEDLTELWRIRTVRIWEVNAKFAEEIKRKLVVSDFQGKLCKAPTSTECPSQTVQKFLFKLLKCNFHNFLTSSSTN